jgi:hypothetical protein
MISFADKVSVPTQVLVRFLDKEAVLLNLDTERYFGLDETGARMWQLLTSQPSVETAYQYDVDTETLRQDIIELLENLTENGLLRLIPSNVENPSTF